MNDYNDSNNKNRREKETKMKRRRERCVHQRRRRRKVQHEVNSSKKNWCFYCKRLLVVKIRTKRKRKRKRTGKRNNYGKKGNHFQAHLMYKKEERMGCETNKKKERTKKNRR